MPIQKQIEITIRTMTKGALVSGLLFAGAAVPPLRAQQLPAQPNNVRQQLNQSSEAQAIPAPVNPNTKPMAKPAPKSEPKPAPKSEPKPAPKPEAKPIANSSAKLTSKPVQNSAAKTGEKAPATAVAPVRTVARKTATGAEKPATSLSAAVVRPAAMKSASGASVTPAVEHPSASRRDPFDPLIGKDKTGGPSPENLPPGKAGLQINTLRLDGIVHDPKGMIAIVSSPQQRVYFIREGDRVYDGQVGQIAMDSVLFHQAGQDPFGKPIERDVTKRLYPTPGEQR